MSSRFWETCGLVVIGVAFPAESELVFEYDLDVSLAFVDDAVDLLVKIWNSHIVTLVPLRVNR